MKNIYSVILVCLLTVGCATFRERRAMRLEAEQTIQTAQFEVQAANSPDTVRYSGNEIQTASRSLERAREEFAKKQYAEAEKWAKSAQDGARFSVNKAKEMKQKEAEAAAMKAKPSIPAKKKSTRPQGR